MGIAGGQTSVGPGPGRGLLHCHEQLGCRLVEAAEEEVRDAKHPEVVAPAVAWTELTFRTSFESTTVFSQLDFAAEKSETV
jgi:hypothetical protein